MFISNKHKVTMSYVSLHARTHARTYVCTVICTQIFLYAFLYIYIYTYTNIYIYTFMLLESHLNGCPWPQLLAVQVSEWIKLLAVHARSMRFHDGHCNILDSLTATPRKVEKVKSYKFTQWLLFYLVGGCNNWSCEWIWVVFLSFSCGAPCWYSFQH